MKTYDKDDVDCFLQRRGDVALADSNGANLKETAHEALQQSRLLARRTLSGLRTVLTHPAVTIPIPFIAGIIAYAESPLTMLAGAPSGIFFALVLLGIPSLFFLLPASWSTLEEEAEIPHVILTVVSAMVIFTVMGVIGTAGSSKHFLLNHRSGLQDYNQAFQKFGETHPRSGAELIQADALPDQYCPGVIKDEVKVRGASEKQPAAATCQGVDGEPTKLNLTLEGTHNVTVRYDDAHEQTVLQVDNLQRDQAHMIVEKYDWTLKSYAPDNMTAFFLPRQ